MRGRATRATHGGRRSAAVFAGIVVGLVCFALPAFAAAPTKGECVDADTRAQSLRREDKLAQARAELLICADVACPKMVRDDCAQRIDELNGAQPTVAFAAKDASGADLSAVKVTIDGAPFADKLDGSSLAVDPGEHDFTFVAAGQTPVTLHIVVHEGEKARREAVVIGTRMPVPAPQATAPAAAATAAVPATSSPRETTPASSSARGSQRVAGVVVGGVGVVGVALGAIFGAKAASDFSAQKSACGSPGCSPADHAQAVSDHGDATNAGTIATVAFIAGGALVAGGLTLFVTAPRRNESDGPAAALRIVPSLGRGSGALLLRGSF
jgi:hypothetical protein